MRMGVRAMKIKTPNIQFNGILTKRQYTRYILVHHSASDTGDAKLFHQWHLNKGWSGIGYHYVIGKDGTIERGRPENTVGAHCSGQRNFDSIAICCVGNFEQYAPTKAQMESLQWLIRNIRGRYGKLPVQRHKDHQATACPGRLFPYQELLKGLEVEPVDDWKEKIISEAMKKGIITERHNPDEPATKWFVLAVALNVLKLAKGDK